MAIARNGKVKEKRAAAYDLAAMAASSEDNKFRIVAEGGLDVLTTMALSRDEVIQEHAVEALAELLTIPSIQDTFVESGGVRTLSAVLHSPVPRVMQEAAYALYTIVADSEENKHAVVEDHGLDDLVHAAHEGTILCQRTVASIFLELIFNAEIRAQIASRNTPKCFNIEIVQPRLLVQLCKTNDPDTLRFSLQSLEVLAIESADLICAQGLQLYSSPDDLFSGLPTLSTLEKLSKMESKQGKLSGSQSSLGSNTRKDAI
ncbi:hypothetical protein RRG08_011630 [Elysia crispata]|uniref:Uncharacterized protein n=1 Tax=Elysia crispata TaxID=231223 RepID=A0AAE0YW38_9GAST|nr:hypothetical protein RRG08_011630 [Elysia crispata]